MIRWTRSLRISSGKYNQQAIQWAKEITEFLNKKYKPQFSVYMDILGEGGTIRWFCDYADLATLEKVAEQIVQDQEYWQKVNQGSDFFMPGSVHDTVMSAI
ncbi:MAG: NIPSNAP family protein [Candidatus Hodarchaeota archaeon]